MTTSEKRERHVKLKKNMKKRKKHFRRALSDKKKFPLPLPLFFFPRPLFF